MPLLSLTQSKIQELKIGNDYVNQAKAQNLRLRYFRLGYCGIDEQAKPLTSEAIGAAGSFWLIFRKKVT